MSRKYLAGLIVAFIMLLSGGAFAVKPPLITDEADTIGKGKAELEFNYEYAHNSHDGITEKENVVESKLTYGAGENIDLSIIVPYKSIKIKGEKEFSSDGLSDLSIDLKWRFFEEHGSSLAIRPRITLPTGDHDKDLGAGKATYSLFLLGTKEAKPWVFHANLGYLRNEHEIAEGAEGGESAEAERKNLLYASVADEVEVTEHLELVADLGMHTNPDKASNTHPAYILGGFIYEVNKSLDLDLGIKGGLTNTEPDYTLLAGIKFKF